MLTFLPYNTVQIEKLILVKINLKIPKNSILFSKYNVDKSYSGTIGTLSYDYKVELEDSTSMFAGINYKF